MRAPAAAAAPEIARGATVKSYQAANYDKTGIAWASDAKGERWIEFRDGSAAWVHPSDLELITTPSPMPTTLTQPDEVLAAPGSIEAAAIMADYETALKGQYAFVRMGLRLINVKARLAHGQYMAWCKKHLPNLAKAHLHRSRFIAEGLLKMTNSKCPPWGTFELPPEIAEIVEGKTSYRALLGEIEEFRHDETEAEAKKSCEMAWKNELLRDDWEPRVLSGELTYTLALKGMTGQEITGGKSRGEDNTLGLLRRNIASFPNCWKRWDALPDQGKMDALSNVGQIVEGAPPAVIAELEKAIAAAKAATR